MCLLTKYPIDIPIPDQAAETVVQVYCQHIYVTLGGSLTLTADNGKELENELFQKVASKLGLKHQFLKSSPSTIQWIFGNILFFNKGLCLKHIHSKTDWKKISNFCSSVLEWFQAFTLKSVHFTAFLVGTPDSYYFHQPFLPRRW